MPRYVNRKTGAEFFSPCECKGADIEQLPEAPDTQKPETAAQAPAAGPKKTTKRKTTK